MHGTFTLRPRANISSPVRGRCGSTPALRVAPRKAAKPPVRCVIHAKRQSAARVRARKVARVSCRYATAREPDLEADLLPY